MRKVDPNPADVAREETARQLLGIIERLEDLNDQAADINSEKAEIRKAAQNDGFDLATIRAILKRRELQREKGAQAVLDADMLLETYEVALGCGAAAAGVLQMQMGADGAFEVKMVSGPSSDAGEKLNRATKARREAVALAELSRRAREGE